MRPQSRAQGTILGQECPLPSVENKRWLPKPLFEKHIHLIRAVWRVLKTQLFTYVLLPVCLSEQVASADTPI